MYVANITVEIKNPAMLLLQVSVFKLHNFNIMFMILTSITHNQRAYKTVVNLITLRLNSIVFVKLPLKTGVIALGWTVLSLKRSWYVNIS